MDIEVNSSEIISECSKQYGKGSLFFRADGLEFEERRAQARQEYLEAHAGIDPEYREAILTAAATPGMTREDVIAAWGLLEEDTRMVFGNVTDNRLAAFAYFNGFAIGANYGLYLKDDIVVGIRETDELVSPHEEELEMRFAEQYDGLHFFYPGGDDILRGSDVDQHHIDWDTLHHHLYRIEKVMPLSPFRIELELKDEGVFEEYELALSRLGYDPKSVPAEVRARIALSVLPYPPLPKKARARESAPVWNPADGPIALPGSSAEIPETLVPEAEPPLAGADTGAASSLVTTPEAEIPALDTAETEPAILVPPEEWFAHVADGRQQVAAFPNVDDKVELLEVEWLKERIFEVEQVPLLVNGVSLYDRVEMEWQDGDHVPHFKRVTEPFGNRTVRAIVNGPTRKDRDAFVNSVVSSSFPEYRYENEVLAFTVSRSELDGETREQLDSLPLSWLYTDTLSHE